MTHAIAKEDDMALRKKTWRRSPEPPKNAIEGSAWVRRYMIDMYNRRDGGAANWQLIAEAAFWVGLEAIDQAPESHRRVNALGRLHAAAYDRLAQTDRMLDCATLPLGLSNPIDLTGHLSQAVRSQKPCHNLLCGSAAVGQVER